MNIISRFIWSERFEYADINKFAFKLGQAVRYYEFLLIIIDRYKKINNDFISLQEEEKKLLPAKPGINRVTPEEGQLMIESGRLTNLLHLEIESFYLFAKVFLDNIARFLFSYFGEARGVPQKSHNNLTKYKGQYFKDKGLVVPEGISESIVRLKNNICDYRDKEISHEMTLRRIHGTTWGASKETRIMGGILNPRINDKTSMTKELPQLMEDINIYIQQVIKLIESNRDKSRLELKDKTSQD